MTEWSSRANCRDCNLGLKGRICGVDYRAWKMRKEPRPYCSCEAISSRAADPLLRNTANLYGYCRMGGKNVHCRHRGALELEERADPADTPLRDIPDSIKWKPKLYVGDDPETLARVGRELAEHENGSSAS
ncbi:unnamed protein product [Zymoseptoria tritici ST99CH_1E4]|uniref:Uncharacterized protein n=1 Tax=Zymoseptoria tritici ST99CH_1E4 TaxID=1276532 RepID=A0A2H1GLW6_ZYMTR|nr:unnamed protein product [Zymoseptoria tritici ST99CH_1E4]